MWQFKFTRLGIEFPTAIHSEMKFTLRACPSDGESSWVCSGGIWSVRPGLEPSGVCPEGIWWVRLGLDPGWVCSGSIW